MRMLPEGLETWKCRLAKGSIGCRYGDASSPIFPGGGERAQFHQGCREVQRLAALADPRDQAARGRVGRRPVSAGTTPGPADRTRRTHVAAAQAMLRKRSRGAFARVG